MSGVWIVTYVIAAVVATACMLGSIAAVIAEFRGGDRGAGFAWGFLLGFVGIAVVSLQRAGVRMPDAPTGLVAVRCYTCNAVQNVATDSPSFMCWQCDSPTIMAAVVAADGENFVSTVCPACSSRIRVYSDVAAFFCPHCSDRVNVSYQSA